MGMTQLRSFLTESNDFKLFVETPGVSSDDKLGALEGIATKYGYAPVTTNFLKVLVENKRINLLEKMINAFEDFYRAEKGQVVCKVSSAEDLSAAQKKQVEKTLQGRAGSDAKLIVEYETNSALVGGLLVKMGDQIFDFTVSSKLDRLQAQLMAPVA